MKYPSRSEYYSAIRHPKVAFRKIDPYSRKERDLDPSLVTGKAVEKIKFAGIKDIWSASGSFAIAFKYETVSPAKIWAVRCFYRSNFDVVAHYKKVLKHLKNSSVRAYFVDFFLIEQGIRVGGTCYPIIKMEWIEGKNLKKFIKDNLHRKNVLDSLAQSWLQLANKLLNAGIAHGDLQHGNVFVSERFGNLSLKLIDYDSLYFDRDSQTVIDNIKGLSDYQHPLRKSLETRCLAIDFFPQLVIYLSILALAEDKRLWNAYKLDDRDGLLFTRADFENPKDASIFQSLAHLSPATASLAHKLQQICQMTDFASIPSLDRVIAGELSLTTSIKPKINWGFDLSRLVEPTLSLGRNSYLWLKHSSTGFTKLKFKPVWRYESNILKKLASKDRSDDETAKPVILPRKQLVNSSKEISNSLILWWQNHLSNISAFIHYRHNNEAEIAGLTPQNSVDDLVTNIITPTGTDNKVAWNPCRYKSQPLNQNAEVEVAAQLNYGSNPENFATAWKTDLAARLNHWFGKWHRLKRHMLAIILKTNRKLSRTLTSCQTKFRNQLEKNKKAIAAKTKRKTWTTRQVADRVERSVSWCHNQRYQKPEEFRLGVHYYKDEYETIQWTKKGIKQLLRIRDAKDNMPKNSLPTKVVSASLKISPQLITRTKAKYSSDFIEGTHYYLNSKNHYLWTPKGIELLKKLVLS